MSFLGNDPVSSVVIAGTGGFSMEIYDYLVEQAANGGPRVAGFIDRNRGTTAPHGIDLPFLATIDEFKPSDGQVVVVAIGSVNGRTDALQHLWRKGVRTPSFVARSAIVSPSASLGSGVLVCPFSIINRDARIGDGVVVNVHCSVGHRASIGAHSILCPYSALNGDARVGKGCFLGTRATIYPEIGIGDGCIVDSHTGVRSNAGDRQIISSRGSYLVNPLRGA